MAVFWIGELKMRYLLITLSLLLFSIGSARAEISIGINMSAYPRLVAVPGYPVYYAPEEDSNYFFYDSQYWVYWQDNWYASNWYDGPWQFTEPEYVPAFVLRVPVRYYRQPPVYFRGWRNDAPPRWGEHWGRDWEERRSGWNQWDHHATPRREPFPDYQQRHSQDRYPRAEQQHSIQSGHSQQSREAVRKPDVQQQNGNQGHSRAEPQQQRQQQERRTERQQDWQQQPQHQPRLEQQQQRPSTEPQGKGLNNRNEELGQDREQRGQDRHHDRR
jgi:hypothetical protein